MKTYLNFINESFIDDFNKKYFKLFDDVDSKIRDDIGMLFKKLSDENEYKPIMTIVYNFMMSNRNNFNSLLSDTNDDKEIDKLFVDNLNVIYFGFKGSTIKLNIESFTIPIIFDRTKDKNLLKLMSMDESSFTSAVNQYSEDVLNEMKKEAGIEEENILKEEVDSNINSNDNPNTEKPEFTTNISKEDEDKEREDKLKLEKYNNNVKAWFNDVYELLNRNVNETRTKINSEEQKNRTIYNFSDHIDSKNKDAKNSLLTNLSNLDTDDLSTVGTTLGVDTQETGEF